MKQSYVFAVIADIHFGSIDPGKQYNILNEQFLQRIAQIDFDILSIDGDIFDKKYVTVQPSASCYRRHPHLKSLSARWVSL